MLKGDVDIGLRQTVIAPITKKKAVNCWPFQYIMLVVMGELDTGTMAAIISTKE